LLRFVPVERINAIMVISPQREYLTQVGSWIERLDGSGGERLYVYAVQNGDAEYISGVLNQVFEGSAAAAPVRASGDVAPSRRPAELSTGGTGGGGAAGGSATRGRPPSGDTDLEANSLSVMQSFFPEQVSVDTGLGSSVMGNVRIIPDTENNSLLIWATNQNYEKILNALRKVDITPRQVLVEATIAEVLLNDELEFGLQWYFENNVGAYEGIGSLSLPTNVPIETPNPADSVLNNAFSYALVDSAGFIRALLRTLAQENKLRILSSPQLMVIDNQEANIRVGDQVPVQTSTTVTTGGNTVESIEYRDTGVLLTVRPQVNAGGLVTMDLNQEVTDVGEIDDATGQRSFLQRTINSKVAIQTGKTIVLGGLIRENDAVSRSGVPILYKLPIVGPLFGRVNESFRRTELIVLITPRVIRDNAEAEQVTAELRDRMQSLTPITEDLFQPSELRF
jgi:general secretion pathway protein D